MEKEILSNEVMEEVSGGAILNPGEFKYQEGQEILLDNSTNKFNCGLDTPVVPATITRAFVTNNENCYKIQYKNGDQEMIIPIQEKVLEQYVR